MATHPHLDRLIAEAIKLGPARMAVAYPLSVSAIEGTIAARNLGLADPILVGPRARIEEVAREKDFDLTGAEFHETADDPLAAAAASVGLCKEGRAEIIMKGSLHSDQLLTPIVGKDSGLRTGRRTSHAFVFDIPKYSKLLLIADCVVNISPGLMDKRDITQNAIDLAHKLGVACPYVGILSAVETVNPAIVGTIDAAALSKMAQRGQITGAVVDGPLGFDNAISLDAAQIKEISSPISGRPDILIVPNLEAGNMLYKQLIYLAHAECAGILLGTRVPIVLTSRADSEKCRIASCALAVLKARAVGASQQRRTDCEQPAPAR
jgi:phosphate acetyltransferase